MDPLAHVVVGLDGSASAEGALRWVTERMPDTGAIETVHARSTAEDSTNNLFDIDAAVQPMHVRAGEPADVLLDLAGDVAATSIVVGAHGAGEHVALGSVTRHLLHHSMTPVIVVDGVDPAKQLDAASPVVACVGYGRPGEVAARWGASYASSRGLPLVLLHAVAFRPIFPVDSPVDMLGSYFGTGVSAEWAQLELDGVAEVLRTAFPAVAISTHIDGGSALRSIIDAGKYADLVVLGKRHDDAFTRNAITPRLRRLVARTDFPTAIVPTCVGDR